MLITRISGFNKQEKNISVQATETGGLCTIAVGPPFHPAPHKVLLSCRSFQRCPWARHSLAASPGGVRSLAPHLPWLALVMCHSGNKNLHLKCKSKSLWRKCAANPLPLRPEQGQRPHRRSSQQTPTLADEIVPSHDDPAQVFSPKSVGTSHQPPPPAIPAFRAGPGAQQEGSKYQRPPFPGRFPSPHLAKHPMRASCPVSPSLVHKEAGPASQ